MLRFTIRQLLGMTLAISLLLAIAVPFGWLGAVVLGISLPVAAYVGTGTLLAFRMSRVTSLALTVFVTSLAVIFVLGLLADHIHPQLLLLRVPPQALLVVAMAAAGIVWLLLVCLTKRNRAPSDLPPHPPPATNTDPPADEARGSEHW